MPCHIKYEMFAKIKTDKYTILKGLQNLKIYVYIMQKIKKNMKGTKNYVYLLKIRISINKYRNGWVPWVRPTQPNSLWLEYVGRPSSRCIVLNMWQ